MNKYDVPYRYSSNDLVSLVGSQNTCSQNGSFNVITTVAYCTKTPKHNRKFRCGSENGNRGNSQTHDRSISIAPK
eukprot:scaffold51711_cov66-Attheya_sp.AAC.9